MRETLVRACLAPSPSLSLEAATEADWETCLAELARHRLVSYAFYVLRGSGLILCVPERYRTAMTGEYLLTLSANRRLVAATARMIAVIAKRGVRPLVLKGIAMASCFYPDLGMRPMGDIDLAVTRDEIDEAIKALAAIGFSQRPDLEGGDAVYLVSEAGVLCDLHYRLRLFEAKEHLHLTTQVESHQPELPVITVLEPNAMVVHLVTHMDGHQDQTGPVLGWIVDLAMVLRTWGSQLDSDRIRLLMPAGRPMQLLGRLLKLLRDDLGEEVPASLMDLTDHAVPLPLAQVLRQRKLKGWGLPRARGWARLLAGTVGLPLKHSYPRLSWDDLLGMAPDAVRDARSRRRGRRHVLATIDQ